MRRLFFLVVLVTLAAGAANAWQLKGGNIELTSFYTEEIDRSRSYSASHGIEQPGLFSALPTKAWVSISIRGNKSERFNLSMKGKLVGTGLLTSNWQSFCFPVSTSLIEVNKVEVVLWFAGNWVNTVQYKDLCFAYTPVNWGTHKLYEGIVHLHTTFSDGKHSVVDRAKKAKQLGYQFMVLTDHYESINKAVMQNGQPVGFSKYLEQCRAVADASFMVFPGCELCSRWKSGNVTMDGHIIAWGNPRLDPVFDRSTNQYNTAWDLVKECFASGMNYSVAHPNLVPFETKLVHGFVFNFSEIQYPQAFQGIEFFNDDNDDQSAQTLSRYLSLVSQRIKVYPTAGCDSHSSLYPGDAGRWERATLLYLEKFDVPTLLYGIRDERSIATNHRTIPLLMSMQTDGYAYLTDNPRFVCSFGFRDPQTPSKFTTCPIATKIRIYRDGLAVAGSESGYKKGTKTLEYDFTDKAAPIGHHEYLLVIDNCLVTSPITVVVAR